MTLWNNFFRFNIVILTEKVQKINSATTVSKNTDCFISTKHKKSLLKQQSAKYQFLTWNSKNAIYFIATKAPKILPKMNSLPKLLKHSIRFICTKHGKFTFSPKTRFFHKIPKIVIKKLRKRKSTSVFWSNNEWHAIFSFAL